MDPLPILLEAAIAAAVAAAVLLLLHLSPARRHVEPATRRTVAILGAFVTGNVLVAGWPELPPASAAGWIPWLAVLSAIAGCLLAAPAVSAKRRRFVSSAAAAAIPALLLRPLFSGASNPAEMVAMLALSAIACHGGWIATLRLEKELPPGPVLGHLAFCCGGAAAVIGLSGSLGFARMAGVLAAGTAAVAVLAHVLSRDERGAGAGVVVLGILASILIAAAAYADLPRWGAACLWLATLAGWVVRLPRLAGLRGWQRAAIVLGVSGALIAAPLIAGLLATQEMQELPGMQEMQGE